MYSKTIKRCTRLLVLFIFMALSIPIFGSEVINKPATDLEIINIVNKLNEEYGADIEVFPSLKQNRESSNKGMSARELERTLRVFLEEQNAIKEKIRANKKSSVNNNLSQISTRASGTQRNTITHSHPFGIGSKMQFDITVSYTYNYNSTAGINLFTSCLGVNVSDVIKSYYTYHQSSSEYSIIDGRRTIAATSLGRLTAEDGSGRTWVFNNYNIYDEFYSSNI